MESPQIVQAFARRKMKKDRRLPQTIRLEHDLGDHAGKRWRYGVAHLSIAGGFGALPRVIAGKVLEPGALLDR
jgi:hypothetical protein